MAADSNVVAGINGVLALWRQRLEHLQRTGQLTAEQRFALQEGVHFLRLAIEVFGQVADEPYDPRAFLRYLDQELDSTFSRFLADEVPASVAPARDDPEPSWTHVLELCAHDLKRWVSLLLALQGLERKPPVAVRAGLDQLVETGLRPAMVQLQDLALHQTRR